MKYSLDSLNFSTEEKIHLSTSRDLEEKIRNKQINELSKQMIEWNLSPEYVRGFKDSCDYRISLYHKYKIGE